MAKKLYDENGHYVGTVDNNGQVQWVNKDDVIGNANTVKRTTGEIDHYTGSENIAPIKDASTGEVNQYISKDGKHKYSTYSPFTSNGDSNYNAAINKKEGTPSGEKWVGYEYPNGKRIINTKASGAIKGAQYEFNSQAEALAWRNGKSNASSSTSQGPSKGSSSASNSSSGEKWVGYEYPNGKRIINTKASGAIKGAQHEFNSQAEAVAWRNGKSNTSQSTTQSATQSATQPTQPAQPTQPEQSVKATVGGDAITGGVRNFNLEAYDKNAAASLKKKMNKAGLGDQYQNFVNEMYTGGKKTAQQIDAIKKKYGVDKLLKNDFYFNTNDFLAHSPNDFKYGSGSKEQEKLQQTDQSIADSSDMDKLAFMIGHGPIYDAIRQNSRFYG